MKNQALIIWCTGMSGSGKTTLTKETENLLTTEGYKVFVIDGDIKRSNDRIKLSFRRSDIIKNNLSIADQCLKIRFQYDIIYVSVISPYNKSREMIRNKLSPNFKLVFMDAKIESLIERDVKGLYKKAKEGQISDLIGYSKNSPYEKPLNPDLIIDTNKQGLLANNIKILYKFTKSSINI